MIGIALAVAKSFPGVVGGLLADAIADEDRRYNALLRLAGNHNHNPWGPVRKETELEKLYRLEEHVF